MLTSQEALKKINDELIPGFELIKTQARDMSSIFYSGESDIAIHVARNVHNTQIEDTGREILSSIRSKADRTFNPYLKARNDPVTISIYATAVATYEPNDPDIGYCVVMLKELVKNGKPKMPIIYSRQEPLSAAANIINLLFLTDRTSSELFKQTMDFLFTRRDSDGLFKGYYGIGCALNNLLHFELELAYREFGYSWKHKKNRAFDQETNASVAKTFPPERWYTDSRIKPAMENVHEFLITNEYPYVEDYPNVDLGITHAILLTDPNLQVEQLPAKKRETLEKNLTEREAPTLERKLHRINQLIQLQKTLSSRV